MLYETDEPRAPGTRPQAALCAFACLLAAAAVLAACGGGGSGSAPTAAPPVPQVRVSGMVRYEFVPPNTNCLGLDFNDTIVRPIRGATVQLLDSGGRVLASTTADDIGGYSFPSVDAGSDVRLRVRAELKRLGAPSWDVEVRDNVVDPAQPNPPALAVRPLYAMDSMAFNTGANGVTRHLTATTGWGGSTYTADRVAAPFAILDAIYSAMQLVTSVEPGAAFPPLDVYWSANNLFNVNTDIDAGQLPASFYRRDLDALFLLGDADVDTEEFDDHVVVHEWGHYFEEKFSRSDSIGGNHSIGDRLEPRLAFSEGWATALAGIALGNPLYCDTGPAGSTGGFGIGAEQGAYDARGWYDEISVVRFIYDLWDDNDEGGDTGTLGFAPIYDVMVGPQAFSQTLTSVFSFAAELRAMLPPADQAFLDSQLLREDMTPGFNEWGAGELNDAGAGGNVLPVYAVLAADGSAVNVCTVPDFDPRNENNKIGEMRFLRIDVPAASRYEVDIVTTTTAGLPPGTPSDPDAWIYRDGVIVASGLATTQNRERFTTPVLAGPATYVAEVLEFRYVDDATASTFPAPMCFDVSMTPVP